MIQSFAEPSDPVLNERDVHVWRVCPTRPFNATDDVARNLSADELERAARLHSPRARDRFVARRHALRSILSSYVNVPAGALVLHAGPLGKPALHDARVHFSVSHSDDVVLIAISAAPVGIDVEHVHPPRRLDRTARRVLHPRTAATLRQLPPARRVTAFFDAWTQREAHVKAVGGGLFHTPDTLPFELDLPCDGSAREVIDLMTGDAWSVARFIPEHGTRAAVVVMDRAVRLCFLDWKGTP
jgi:4'-phosphopantetheinyl transferase